MRKELKIKTSDKKAIYGTLDTSSGRNSRLIIFVHGLAGNQNAHIFFNAATFFSRKGYDIFRFNLYSWQKDARRLREITVAQQARDLDTIVRYFQSKYKNIFVVGHSLGGPTIFLSDHSKIKAIVLWDPSFDLKKLMSQEDFSREYNAYILEWGPSIIFGNQMFEEYQNFPDPLDLIRQVKVPIKIILAGKNKILVKGCRLYYKHANEPKALSVIKNADHNFDEEGVEEELFKETLRWIRTF